MLALQNVLQLVSISRTAMLVIHRAVLHLAAVEKQQPLYIHHKHNVSAGRESIAHQ